MYQLDITNQFKRAYKKLDNAAKNDIDDAIKLLMKGRPYPKSLTVKKMKGHQFVFEALPTDGNTYYFSLREP